MARRVINPNLNGTLQNGNFTNIPSSTINKIGDFSIDGNFSNREIVDFSAAIERFGKPLTLADISEDIDKVNQINALTRTITLNNDKSDLSSYVNFASMEEFFVVSVGDIIDKFPASIFVNNELTDVPIFSVFDYIYDIGTNTSSFKSDVRLFENNFGIIYTRGNSSTDFANINLSFKDYTIWRVGETSESHIIGFTGSTAADLGYIRLVVNGNPFPEAINSGVLFTNFHIKPKYETFSLFLNQINEFQKYLLSRKEDGAYIFTIKEPIFDDNETFFNELDLRWEIFDGYNIDIVSASYLNFIQALRRIGAAYDTFKTDLVFRKLMPNSLKDYDFTDTNKIQKLSRLYGAGFDKIKKFIDNLVHVNKVSYNKKNNIPDALIKNFARTLGWQTFNIISEQDLFKSFLGEFDGITDEPTLTPYEIDIELWRRIVINTSYLLKAKGTRKALFVIFEMLGCPEELIEINEHVYIADKPIDVTNIIIDTISLPDGFLLPNFVDEEGFPISSPESESVWFQLNGNEDAGKQYMDFYRNLGYDITKVVDNKKSWLPELNTRLDGANDTLYEISDNRLLINTKEVSLLLNPSRFIEKDVYKFNRDNGVPINLNIASPYPNLDSNKFDVSELSFVEYIQKVSSTFIDVKNRKILPEYPTLRQLYYDYLRNPLSKQYKYIDVLTFTSVIDKFWYNFIDHLIPATTIVTELGTMIENTIFNTQKFQYKRGINDGSEFTEIQPIMPEGEIVVSQIEFSKPLQVEGLLNTYKIEGIYDIDDAGTDALAAKAVTETNFEFFSIQLPVFDITNQCKIDENINQDCVFFFDIETERNVEYQLSGGTNVEVRVDVFKYEEAISGFSDTKVFSFDAPVNASRIFNFSIPKNVLERDAEYLIKPYFVADISIGESVNPVLYDIIDYYGNFDTVLYPTRYLNSPIFFDGLNDDIDDIFFSTEDIRTNLPFRKYDELNDYYFASLGTPSLPVINVDAIPPVQSYSYFTENIPLPFSSQTEFFISALPEGSVQLAYDGVNLTVNEDYIIDANDPQRINLNFDIDNFNGSRRLSATYLVGTGTLTLFNEIIITPNLIPSGTVNSTNAKVFFNTGISRSQILLDNDIATQSSVRILLNGLVITNGQDFTFSSFNRRLINLNVNLNAGDILQVYYIFDVGTTPIIDVGINPFVLNFDAGAVIQASDVGFFRVEITSFSDFNYENIEDTIIVDYIEGERTYSVITPILSPALSIKRIRVVNVKEFTTLNLIILQSTQESGEVLVRVPL